MKKFRWHIITLLCVMASVAVSSPRAEAAGPSAAEVVKQCVDKIDKAKALAVNFEMTASNGAGEKGAMTIAKERFALQTNAMRMWYDGATQYTLDNTENELTLTNPTAEELAQSNPFVILNNYKQQYNLRLLSGEANEYVVEFVPKAKNDAFTKASVTFNKTTSMPTHFVVHTPQGVTLTFKVTVKSLDKAPSVKAFRCNTSDYPDVNINDLR